MLRLVINLDRAHERLAFMRDQLDALGLAWTRVPAFDCKEFSSGFVDDIYRKSPRLKQDPGSIGAFMTHRHCWSALVESDETHALIMEDDILFGRGAKEFLANSNWLPNAYSKSVVHLETFGRITILDAEPLGTTGEYGLHIQRRLHHGSAAYLIHRDTAAKALAASEDLNNVPDIFLFDPPPRNEVHALPVLQVSPAPFVQEDILQRMTGRSANHKSMIAETRKGNRKGLAQLQVKLAHSLGKRWTIASGKLADRLRGTKTGVVNFE